MEALRPERRLAPADVRGKDQRRASNRRIAGTLHRSAASAPSVSGARLCAPIARSGAPRADIGGERRLNGA